ncbi:MAG TPA: flagellar export protein FliJ [Bacteroidetes bacterium]|nr:flagellar export protein FliJ [Bacteroidota bacterium]
MAFRFRYQRILDVRRQQEKAKAQEVARRQAAVLKQQREMESLERAWQDARGQWLRTGSKGASAQALQEQIRYLEGIRSRIEDARAELARLVDGLNRAREELVELMKQRKVLEKLEEKARAAYEARQNRLDQLLLDETATSRQWRAQLEQARSGSKRAE